MDTKKLIIIGIVAIILIAAAIILVTNSVNYERIEITPNGTSIEVPANQTRYVNDIESIKIWKWNDGVLLTHNSQENGYDIINLTGSGYNAMADLIKNGEMEYALESKSTVQDDVLQRELAHTSDEKMKSIISTIQREQNVIIRNERAKNMIIQGVAGSGKTSMEA